MNSTVNLVATMLANKGQNVLSEVISNVTDEGIHKVKEFIEEKTGIPLTDADGSMYNFNSDELDTINITITDNRLELERILNELTSLHLEDVQHARHQQEKVMDNYVEALTNNDNDENIAKRLWFSANFIYLFALLITFQIFGFLFFAVFGPVATDKMRFVDIAIGNLFGILNIIVGFFFGSAFAQSRNRTRNTDTIQSIVQKAKDTFK